MKLFAFDLVNRLSPEGNEPYNAVPQELAKETAIAIDIEVQPILRATASFAYDTASCQFPTSLDAKRIASPEMQSAALIETAPFDYVSLRVYTRPGDALVRSMQGLEGRHVGFMAGSVAGTLAKQAGAIAHAAKTEAQLSLMLERKRIDSIVGHYPDVVLAMVKQGSAIGHFDPAFSVYKTGVTIVCHDTPDNRRFVEKASKVIIAMRRDGRMKTLLGEHSDVVPVASPTPADPGS